MNRILQGDPSILAALSIALVTISVLLGIVTYQYWKIRDLNKPKYGFLGKPIAIGIVGMLSIFTVTGYGFYQNNYSPTDVSVSDPIENPNPTYSYLQIEYEPINENTFLYRFYAVPVINDVEWGTNSDLSFSVSWKIENSNSINKEEPIINKDFPGGIIITLEKGLNVVTAEMNIGGTIYVESIKIRI